MQWFCVRSVKRVKQLSVCHWSTCVLLIKNNEEWVWLILPREGRAKQAGHWVHQAKWLLPDFSKKQPVLLQFKSLTIGYFWYYFCAGQGTAGNGNGNGIGTTEKVCVLLPFGLWFYVPVQNFFPWIITPEVDRRILREQSRTRLLTWQRWGGTDSECCWPGSTWLVPKWISTG